MTIPKKGLRNITVDKIKYAWNATGNDGGIGISIIPIKQQNHMVTAGFGYHSKVVEEYTLPDGGKGQVLKQQTIITGHVVRQVILYAIKAGWGTLGTPAILHLGSLDDKIDLRIDDRQG